MEHQRMSRWLTPPQIAELLAVDQEKVRDWIKSGQLDAYNVASTLNGKPRWRVSPEEFDKFLNGRKSAAGHTSKRSRRPRQHAEVISFYPDN